MTRDAQQPKEYIITFDELQELKPDVAEGMYKSTKEQRQEKTIFRVLSRPHPAPAPDEMIVSRAAVDELEKEIERTGEIVRQHIAESENHDAATRRQAREDVLKEIEGLKKVCRWYNWCTKYMGGTCKGRCDFFQEISINKIIKSLRGDRA